MQYRVFTEHGKDRVGEGWSGKMSTMWPRPQRTHTVAGRQTHPPVKFTMIVAEVLSEDRVIEVLVPSGKSKRL